MQYCGLNSVTRNTLLYKILGPNSAYYRYSVWWSTDTFILGNGNISGTRWQTDIFKRIVLNYILMKEHFKNLLKRLWQRIQTDLNNYFGIKKMFITPFFVYNAIVSNCWTFEPIHHMFKLFNNLTIFQK